MSGVDLFGRARRVGTFPLSYGARSRYARGLVVPRGDMHYKTELTMGKPEVNSTLHKNKKLFR